MNVVKLKLRFLESLSLHGFGFMIGYKRNVHDIWKVEVKKRQSALEGRRCCWQIAPTLAVLLAPMLSGRQQIAPSNSCSHFQFLYVQDQMNVQLPDAGL
jgi:hypothetical protein